MIICIAEFGVRPGMEQKHLESVQEMMREVVTIDGFISKETFESRNNPGKLLTVSCWRDAASLQAWMRNRPHMQSIALGKREIFSHYTIQIADVTRENAWVRDPA